MEQLTLRTSILVICLVLLSVNGSTSNAFAQYGAAFDSPRSFALGRAAISDPGDEWSSNAAVRADTSSHVRVLLSPDPILAGSLSAGVSGDIPIDASMTLGAAFSNYQYGDVFSWQSYNLQTSKTFSVSGHGDQARYASAGLRLRYVQQKYITDGNLYIPSDDLTADLGATFDLIAGDQFPQLSAGVAVTHLLSLSYNQSIPIEDRAAWIGLTYRPLDDLTFDAALESPTGSPAVFHFGAEYAFDANLFIRAGDITGIGDISAGIGVRTGSLIADFAAVRHSILGTTVSFGIAFVL